MSGQEVNQKRRKILVAATSGVGVVAAVGVAIPFVESMLPSARAKAAGAPVEADISKIEKGMQITVAWRGKPVWILNRTKEMLDNLQKDDGLLSDPNSDQDQQPAYCKNQTRSRKPEYFVCIGICTHLGCSPTFRPEVGAPDIGAYWNGGYLCPCHGSRFDLAGRVFNGSPAPTNLVIPPYYYVDDTHIRVGEDSKGA
jgi:ubiquinol-cytochrome c reductase iron-sulfur subunit